MSNNPTDRLITTIGLMDRTAAEHDGEAVNAFRAATRMLKAQGLTWTELAKMALDRPSLRPMGLAETAAKQGFGDIFEDIFGDVGRPKAPPPPPPKRRVKSRVRGVDVPETIKGTILVVESDRTAKTGPMLVLEIVAGDVTYGPLVCLSAPLQTDLRAALDAGRTVICRIQKPRTDDQMPVVVSANATGD